MASLEFESALPAAPSSAVLSQLRVAIVHHWFIHPGGAERVIEALGNLLPQADLFTLLLRPGGLPPSLASHNITTSFLQHLPGGWRLYHKLLPLYPLALEQFDLDKYDLVISSESGPAKGVLTRASTLHICYCNTPMRYLWEMTHDYSRRLGGGILGKSIYALFAHYIRQWDYASSARVDHFVAGSHNSARRIWKTYRRRAHVIHSPVQVLPITPPRSFAWRLLSGCIPPGAL